MGQGRGGGGVLGALYSTNVAVLSPFPNHTINKQQQNKNKEKENNNQFFVVVPFFFSFLAQFPPSFLLFFLFLNDDVLVAVHHPCTRMVNALATRVAYREHRVLTKQKTASP